MHDLFYKLFDIHFLYSEGYRWLAMDMDGDVYAYKSKPYTEEDGYWKSKDLDYVQVMDLFCRPGTIVNDWKDSLTEITEAA